MLIILVSLTAISPYPLRAEEAWTPPREISEDQFGWFPDLAADHAGTVHVIWGSGTLVPDARDPSAPEASLDLLRYRALRNGAWTPMNDVAFTCTGGYTVRNSVVINTDGRLHALVRTCFEVSSMSVPADEAWSALSWTAPQRLDNSYYNALTADSQGRLHALYQDLVTSEPGQPNLASEIFYRNSNDGGQSWSVRTNLTNLAGGDERMQIKVDPQDRIHVVWDHGSDWYLGIDQPDKGIYRRSDDGGASWQPQIALGIAGETIAQNALGVTLEGNPLVVYRSTTSNQVFFQYSPDGGNTWTAAEVIEGVQARDVLELGLDHYSMAVDSANRMHLLMVGFPKGSRASIPMLLHLTWDGQRWSAPVIVAQGPNRPMWPQVIVAQGNQLHTVWFTYTDASGWGDRRIWHSSKLLDSPLLAPATLISLPTAAAPLSEVDSSTEPLLELQPSSTAAAQPASFRDRPPPGSMSTQSNVISIALALASVSGLLVIVTLFTLWRRARK